MIRVNVLQSTQVHVCVGGQTAIIEGEHYDGEYDVVPNFETQILETAKKKMDDDVTVHPVPVYRTSNPQGGKTIFIGGNLDG